jgi:ceramide glucosyltransferase
MGWKEVWAHQLRWARTIRACQGLPFFLSLLSNGTLWPLLWLAVSPSWATLGGAVFLWALRIWTARSNELRLTGSTDSSRYLWLVPLKDLGSVAIWALAFIGSHIHWRGESYRMLPDGKLAGPL